MKFTLSKSGLLVPERKIQRAPAHDFWRQGPNHRWDEKRVRDYCERKDWHEKRWKPKLATAYVDGVVAADGSSSTHDYNLGSVAIDSVVACAFLWWNNSPGSVTSVVQQAGTATIGTFSMVGSLTVQASSGASAQQGYCVVTGAGTLTIRITTANASQCNLVMHEVSGCDTSAPFDQTSLTGQSVLDNNVNTITTGTPTTTTDGQYVFGFNADTDNRGATIVAGTNFTLRDSGSLLFSESLVQVSQGAIAATFTMTVGAIEYALTGMMTFKEAAAGATGFGQPLGGRRNNPVAMIG